MVGENRYIIFYIRGIVEGGWFNGFIVDYDFERFYWIDVRCVCFIYDNRVLVI